MNDFRFLLNWMSENSALSVTLFAIACWTLMGIVSVTVKDGDVDSDEDEE